MDMTRANQYLKDVFIPPYWNKHVVVSAKNSASEFTPIAGHLDLRHIFCLKEYRKIRNDDTFSYGNKFYLIDSPLRSSIAKQKIEIRTTHAGKFHAYFAGKKLLISEVIEPSKLSMADLEIQKKVEAIVLSDKLQNVAEAVRISGLSRQTIYKNRKIFKEQGAHALKRTFRKDHYHKNRTNQLLKNQIIEFSLKNPHLGQAQVALQLNKLQNIEISPSSVRHIWLKTQIQTTALRVQKAASETKKIKWQISACQQIH